MAGIYHNAELGVISMSSDGENWLTIADKNLGATQVYNDGDTLSEANSGKYYQWGNNYGFPYGQGQSVTSTAISASAYGPTNYNYYESSTLIVRSGTGISDFWDSSRNTNLWGGKVGTVNATRGPCPEGFHIPTESELRDLQTKGYNLGLWSMYGAGSLCNKYLKIPIMKTIGYDGVWRLINGVGSRYWTASNDGENLWFLHIEGGYFLVNGAMTNMGCPIRAFKNESVAPDDSWTTLYDGSSIATGAGIFHNPTLGLISISSDGTNWLTIADKNVGATTVWNYGDEITASNAGYAFQRGNNHGFEYESTFTTSSTQVNASSYGATDYYNSSTFRSQSYDNVYIWDSSYNNNLWGNTTNTNIARRGPCPEGFHIPSGNDLYKLLNSMSQALGIWNASNTSFVKQYYKIPLCGQINKLGSFSGGSGAYWSSDYGSTNRQGYYSNIQSDLIYHTSYDKAVGLSIRPFANTPVVPDYTWERLYGDELPAPKNYIKRFQNNGNYYYFGDAPIHASGVTLNKSSLTLTEAGQTEQLVATVTPSDAVEKSVTWTSSDTTVAKVYQDGTVECVNPGDCTITCTVNDGGYTASCSVNSRVDVYVDFLLVGGGGGGGGTNTGNQTGGGGGGGGVIYCSNFNASLGTYSITIGEGGTGGNGSSVLSGSNGGNSTFNGLTAYGGGGGGGCYKRGNDGGSGGGGGGGTYPGGSGCNGQGNNGGGGQSFSGGGGGACGVGTGSGSDAYTGGTGGNGAQYDITGANYYYGGGGGGGSYSSRTHGIGGNGGGTLDATCYGGGGGGGQWSCGGTGNGYTGFQGIFVLRYITNCNYDITGGCKYTCGDYTIHCFTSDGTLCVN